MSLSKNLKQFKQEKLTSLLLTKQYTENKYDRQEPANFTELQAQAIEGLLSVFIFGIIINTTRMCDYMILYKGYSKQQLSHDSSLVSDICRLILL